MVYQHHSAPLIKHSAPFEGSRYHDSNSNFSDLSFHHPKWLQPYVFPSFLGRLTRKKTDHLSVHTNPKVGRFRCFFLVGMMLECQNTHTHTPLTQRLSWNGCVHEGNRSVIPICQHLPPKTSFRPQVRAKLMGAFAGTKMGTGRVETYLPSPHNPMVQWKISLKCKKTHIFDIGDTLNSIFPRKKQNHDYGRIRVKLRLFVSFFV